MPRKSRITMSSAFLFDASSPQVVASVSEVISVLLIKAAATNDFFHRVGYEITNGTMRRNSLSDFGCRDIDFPVDNEVRVIRLAAGPVEDDKPHQFFKIIKS